jgi:hypothetical protein
MNKDEMEYLEQQEQRKQAEREQEERAYDEAWEHERELDELRLKIANLKGWKIYGMAEDSHLAKYLYPLPPGVVETDLFKEVGEINKPLHWQRDDPDWPRDIAAAWELEAEIPEDQRSAYVRQLLRVLDIEYRWDSEDNVLTSDETLWAVATPRPSSAVAHTSPGRKRSHDRSHCLHR